MRLSCWIGPALLLSTASSGGNYYTVECNVAGPLRLAAENQLLEESGGTAFRPDTLTLCLVTDPGDTLVFSDTAGVAESGFGSFNLLTDWLPDQRIWVVWRMEWDFSSWLLVSAGNGTTRRSIGRPVPSPGGTRLLCAFSDLATGHMDTGIEIWRVEEEGPVQEYLALEDARAPAEAEWLSDSLIAYEMIPESGSRADRGELRLNSLGTWEVSEEEAVRYPATGR